MKTIDKNSKHKNQLGYDIPKDYFSSSKEEIINSINQSKENKPIQLNSKWSYLVAASLALLIGATFWFQNNSNKTVIEITEIDNNNQFINSSDNFTVEALFYEDIEFDNFIDQVIVNEVILMAEESETQLDNIFINSLLIDEQSLDSFMDISFINSIIL